ncbi:hypothetical protein [Streptomyces canus]|uniref:hypothetical protein n=1 Tax=Streptomyces canus TaxID=58343 RepID=UPI001319F5DF|nr:hypothetical protein [Streptomyces canus]
MQDEDVTAHLRCMDAWLFLGDQQIAVEVDLGLLLPDTGVWGGVLRRVPGWLAEVSRDAEARLRLPTGDERRIRPLATPDGETSVPFIGEGPAPF